MNTTKFDSLIVLKEIVAERQAAGRTVIPADNIKGRLIGFMDVVDDIHETDEYLYVPFSSLTAEQIRQHFTGEEGTAAEPEPEDLALLWKDSLEDDVMDQAMLLQAGQREAAKAWDSFPSKDMMEARAHVIQRALGATGLEWVAKRPLGSPFTFIWGHAMSASESLVLCTDHLGVTLKARRDQGIASEVCQVERLVWADVLTFDILTEWVEHHVFLFGSVL